MKLALDTSVLLAIFRGEEEGEVWLETLIAARPVHRLVVCDVVYAELAPAFATQGDLDVALGRLGAILDPVLEDAAWRAGRTFCSYRREGGPREHLIPDFLIAAHAITQADRLAATDRGYLRRYFPDLELIGPQAG